jgi:hypothetical protein
VSSAKFIRISEGKMKNLIVAAALVLSVLVPVAQESGTPLSTSITFRSRDEGGRSFVSFLRASRITS